MSIGLKMWPLEHTQGKKLMTDDARRTPQDGHRTQHDHNSLL